jgi:hypothetical protein
MRYATPAYFTIWNASAEVIKMAESPNVAIDA